MAGVPHHAAASYIDILVDQGYKVAICEQVEDPKLAVGMVKREVVQLVTPGTTMDIKAGAAKSNNYLAAVLALPSGYAFAYTDLTTGELKVTTLPSRFAVQNELAALSSKEIVIDPALSEDDQAAFKQGDRLLSVQPDTGAQAEASYVAQDLADADQVAVVERLMQYLLITQNGAWPTFKSGGLSAISFP